MIEVIHEHSVDTSLLPDGANILDIGCRGFLFTNHFRNLGYSVVAVDIDVFTGEDYHCCAISGGDFKVRVNRTNDPQATNISDLPSEESDLPLLNCYSLKTFSEDKIHPPVLFWDLIKMDIEGSELSVIRSLEKAPAKQLSIEFHLHTGIYGMNEMKIMEDKLLSLGYFPVKHDCYEQHGAGKNYWDSLFILQ